MRGVLTVVVVDVAGKPDFAVGGVVVNDGDGSCICCRENTVTNKDASFGGPLFGAERGGTRRRDCCKFIAVPLGGMPPPIVPRPPAVGRDEAAASGMKQCAAVSRTVAETSVPVQMR